MDVIWQGGKQLRRTEYSNEAALEAAIVRIQQQMVGSGRVYLDVERKIGARGGQRIIPDGDLLDPTGREPRRYVVEAELAALTIHCDTTPRKPSKRSPRTRTMPARSASGSSPSSRT